MLTLTDLNVTFLLLISAWQSCFFSVYFNVVFQIHIMSCDIRMLIAHASYVTTAEEGRLNLWQKQNKVNVTSDVRSYLPFLSFDCTTVAPQFPCWMPLPRTWSSLCTRIQGIDKEIVKHKGKSCQRTEPAGTGWNQMSVPISSQDKQLKKYA